MKCTVGFGVKCTVGFGVSSCVVVPSERHHKESLDKFCTGKGLKWLRSPGGVINARSEES